MLNWPFTFFILSLVTGALGFTSLAGGAASIAQVLSILFIGLMIISLISQERHRPHL